MTLRLPSNLRMAAIVADSAHVHLAPELIRLTHSEEAVALLALWKRRIEDTPYLIVAGEMHKPRGGIVGGLAQDWQHALTLFRLTKSRLDDVASAGGGNFTSAWVFLLDAERVQEVQAIIAQTQSVEGRA
jgi:hypothetical protein